MSNAQKKIAIVIFTYNEQERVREVIESALLLTENIVILDNNSTDQTAQIAKDYKTAKFIQHSLKATDFEDKIKLALRAVKNNFSGAEYVMHLNCSEKITHRLADAIGKVVAKNYSAIAVYRDAKTYGYSTHPYHLLYLFRSLTRKHKSYRLVKVDQWSAEKCKIHAEWQPNDNDSSYTIPFWKAQLVYQRVDDFIAFEKKHIEYAVKEEKESVGIKKRFPLTFSFIRCFAFLGYNMPYLIFSFSRVRFITVLQHCRYIKLVGILGYNRNDR